ncbi:ParB/RepB/Spo0J family partition protein [Streptomyces sp. NPDC015171]|uniref:ParB/RepB/Spo0J family partition protein n=1 Tax=Streptomyces sp. NPDC015171 TaxID=3364945 RepID=UPI0036F64703
MSKADQLGAGRFGSSVRPVSARRQAVAAATGVPTEGVAAPTELPVDRISLNPDNPRSALGDLADLAGSLKTHGQKQAITIMNRDAYIKANPSLENDIEPNTTHVVVDGSSRLAAAREAGLATIKVMVSDDQGATSEELLESALVANIHRQDLDEMDEARALQRLMAIHGSQRALAKRLHRSQGWVSQRMALLNLIPQLQSRIGAEPIELLRAVANKPAEQQEAALAELKTQRARKEQPRSPAFPHLNEQTGGVGEDAAQSGRPAESRAGTADDTSTPPSQTGPEAGSAGDGADTDGGTEAIAKTLHSPAPATDASSRGDYGVITTGQDGVAGTRESTATTTAEAIPEPRAHASSPEPHGDTACQDSQPRRVPYDEPGSLAMLLDTKIPSNDQFFDLLRFLGARGLERDSARLGELARSLAEQAATRSD